jgi:hypothetical protein
MRKAAITAAAKPAAPLPPNKQQQKQHSNTRSLTTTVFCLCLPMSFFVVVCE